MCFHYEFCSCGLVFFQTVFCLIQYVNSLLCKSHTIFFLLTMLTRKNRGSACTLYKCLKEISCLVFLSILSCLFPKYVLSDMIREHSAPNVEVNILFSTIITRDKQRICLHIVQMPSKIYFVLSFSKI